jgi:glycosyltransferase involved in cell wall biosynthesis
VAIHEFLRRRGIPCSVINITQHRQAEGHGVFFPKNAVELVGLLMRLPYDVIHLHFGGNLTSRLLGLTLVCCALPKAKTVLTFHSGGYPSTPIGRSAAPRSVRGFVLRRLSRVIGVNADLIDMFRRFGVADDRLRLIPPHAFPSSPPNSPQSAPDGFEQLNDFLEAHDPALLTVGGLEPEYGVPDQVEMLGILRRTLPDAGLAVIGGGSKEREIRALVESKDYAEHVLVCGDVPHAATLKAISLCDLLLRITHYDGDSIAVREALSFGTPVLATDNGMRPDGVHLVSNMTPTAVAEAAVKALGQLRSVSPRVETDETNLEALLALYLELKPDRVQRVWSGAHHP